MDDCDVDDCDVAIQRVLHNEREAWSKCSNTVTAYRYQGNRYREPGNNANENLTAQSQHITTSSRQVDRLVKGEKLGTKLCHVVSTRNEYEYNTQYKYEYSTQKVRSGGLSCVK